MSTGATSTGLTSAGRERLHEVAERYVGDGQDPDRYQVPGLVGLVACGGDVHVEALGTMAVGGAPVRRDTIFRIASDTKPITAAAVLALVAEGRLDLDEPVDRLLPELSSRRVLRRMDGPLDDTEPAHRAITPRDLLTFTFGFGFMVEMFAGGPPWPVMAAEAELHLETIGPPNRDAQPDPDTWMAGLGSLPLLAQPGERWFYNTSASVLGVLAARAAGQPFGEVLRTRIFEPLGMPDTGLWTTRTERLMTAYRPSESGLVAWDQPDGSWSHPPRFGDGAADLVSTADDLLAFSRMLLGGGSPVLPAELARAMTTGQLTAEQKANGGLGADFFKDKSWGFGMAVQDDGSYGWAGGFGSTWLMDPNHDLTVVMLTQRMFAGPEPEPVHTEFQAAAYDALVSKT
ncbi:MAG TPA: serine hydrolase domain-containing protein [Streptosporangiaceae bacterium]|nr:serine hydrolase domain-containing protein [Streptosporangiaceae bacterium]